MTPKLFEMDLFTNTERKEKNTVSWANTPSSNNQNHEMSNTKTYSVSQIQKLKIDLAEKNKKHSKSRSNSLIRNASHDKRKKSMDKKNKKKENVEISKKTINLGSYVII